MIKIVLKHAQQVSDMTNIKISSEDQSEAQVSGKIILRRTCRLGPRDGGRDRSRDVL